MPQADTSALGKRKRQESQPSADKGQARIDRYFAFHGPVKPIDPAPNARSSRKASSDNIQAVCNDALVPIVPSHADVGQPDHLELKAPSHARPGEGQPESATDARRAGNVQLPKCRQTADQQLTPKPITAMAAAKPVNSRKTSQLKRTQAYPPLHKSTAMQTPADSDSQHKLPEHLNVFLEHLTARQQFREFDVAMRTAPQLLAGRKLRVYWPDDDGWYLGTVTHFDAETGKHKVEYDDGDKDEMHLAVERVRLLMHAGERFEAAKPAELEALASTLLAAANSKSALSPRTRKQCLSPGQEQQIKEAEELAQKLRKRGVSLEQHAQHLRASLKLSSANDDAATSLDPAEAVPDRQSLPQQHQDISVDMPQSNKASQLIQPAVNTEQQLEQQQLCPAAQDTEQQQHQQHQQQQSNGSVLAIDSQTACQPANFGQHPAAAELVTDQAAGNAQEVSLQLDRPHPTQEQDEAQGIKQGIAECIRQGTEQSIGQDTAQGTGQGIWHGTGQGAGQGVGQGTAEGIRPDTEQGIGQDTAQGAGQGTGQGIGQGAVQGLVVWGLNKGWPAWPAIVITEEEIAAAKVQGSATEAKALTKGKAPGKVPVHYFGTQEFAWMKTADVIDFGEGLQRGWHLCKRPKAAFLRALHEVSVYFLEGELPSEMVPKHNDDPYSDDNEEEEEQLPAQAAPKAAKLRRPADTVGVKMPLKLSSSLTILSLGRIEFLHPGFHDVKNFWPVGYSVARLAATPASGKKETIHMCEILEAPDGSGPLFRITPKGSSPVEASTATKAWSALFSSHDSARTLGFSGAKQFGLQHPRVQRLLQAMPQAARCDRYAAWIGPPPPVPQLSEEEQQELQALRANMQRLPADIQPQPASQPTGVCHVCFVEDYTDDNLLLECDGCRALVHMDCYGLEHAPEGQSWLCDVCALGPKVQHTPACVLCPVVGPPLRRTSCSRFCHVGCAQWLAETFIHQGLVHGLQNVSKAKHQLVCYLCQQRYGACIQCAGSNKCFMAFHPSCARSAGLVTETVEPGSDYNTSEAESDTGDDPPKGTDQHQASRSADENRDTSNMPEAAIQATNGRTTDHVDHASSAQRRGAMGEGSHTPFDRQGGQVLTPRVEDEQSAGAKHAKHSRHLPSTALASAPKRRKRTGAPTQEGTYIGGGRRMMCYCPKHSHVAQNPHASTQHQTDTSTFPQLVSQAVTLAAKPQASLASKEGQVTGSLGLNGQSEGHSNVQPKGQTVAFQLPEHKAGCVRGVPFNHACRRGQREPDALAAALAKRTFVAQTPYTIGAARQHAAQQMPGTLMHISEEALTERESGKAQAAAKTQTARFKEMQETVGRRLTCGKSAIHGLGAFTKQQHRPEDMVIEYAGEMVRQSVADRREAASYNQMVGAGTYVFSLNDDLLVDATRAGNMAHLLNHSCEPNCYSKHVHVWDDNLGEKVPHVVICAKQAIPVGAELTYDYRFSGKERLPCNCGATKCRGYVNKAVVHEEAYLQVARCKLKQYC